MTDQRQMAGTPRGRAGRVAGVAGRVAGEVILVLATLALLLYFAPSVQGIQAPLLAMALEGRPVHLVFAGAAASPLHGRLGVARPVILDGDDREILRAELLEVDAAGWDGGPAAGSVLLLRPEINLFLCPDGSLSLLQLLKEKRPRDRPREKGSWHVDSLRIEEGLVTIDLPLLTGRIGPVELTARVGEERGVLRGEARLRVARLELELRGPAALRGALAALGWTPARLATLGPLEIRASWDGPRVEIEDADLRLDPLELHLSASLDLDAVSGRFGARGSWDGHPLLAADLALSAEQVRADATLEVPSFAALPLPGNGRLRGLEARPLRLSAAGREVRLRLEGMELEALGLRCPSPEDPCAQALEELSLAGELTLRLEAGTLEEAWGALRDGESSEGLAARLRPVLDLGLEAHLGALAVGSLSLRPGLALGLDASWSPPLRLELRNLSLESALGVLRLTGRLTPRPPLGIPEYGGTLTVEGIDLATLRESIEVPAVLARLLDGRLEGEVVFEGSLAEPGRLSLPRCRLGITGGSSPLGIRCPEGGTVVDPTRAPEIGPMTLLRKEIPWGEGRLLLGPPPARTAP
ncbi:MAG: hypothetical protein FJ098_02755 [Deltaproteobacteria bacterium]|nr:hypothetical protein [Deltaproteobacteria bacterium]